MLCKAFVVWSLLLASPAQSGPAIRKDRVSIYPIDLICPAAREIGCGSAAKPLLLELEQAPGIGEAWLNRSGTLIAVVWKEDSKRSERTEVVRSVLKKEKIRELKGGSRELTLQSFLAGNGWYRGSAVDRLSEEEAGIISARLVRKMRELIEITEEKAKVMQTAFQKVLTQKLTSGEPATPDETHDALLKICHEQLGEKEIGILKDAYEKGVFFRLRDE